MPASVPHQAAGRARGEQTRRQLLAAEGLDDAASGVVVDYSSTPPVVTDGPYGETKELFGGFYLLNVASREEAQRIVQDLWREHPQAVLVTARYR